MIFCFDIDETICSKTSSGKYHEAEPYIDVIESINKLYDEGNEILIMTARGSVSKLDYTELTSKQLIEWGVKYHKLLMNIKPNADIFVDDKGMNIEDYKKKYFQVKKGIIAGSFDIIHPGYIYMFEEAKKHCEHLTVALHRNPAIERKNKLKPILECKDRKKILLSLKYIDEVVEYDTEEDLSNILKKYNFDVRILGDDYKNSNITGKDLTKKIVFVDRQHGWSTTKIKNKIYESVRSQR